MKETTYTLTVTNHTLEPGVADQKPLLGYIVTLRRADGANASCFCVPGAFSSTPGEFFAEMWRDWSNGNK